MEFAFSAEVINPRLDERLFTFRPPPDVEVVEVEAQ
jgi:outer membrane lipoprotein-sorting protein